MTRPRQYSVELAPALLGDLLDAAEARGQSAADFIRAAIADAVAPKPPNPAPDNPAGAERLAPLVDALACATDWFDMQSRLRGLGYVLRRDCDGRLVLCSWPLERALMPVSKLGHSAEALSLRFGAPFPDSRLAKAQPARAA
ncbi:MAG: hypothetical protein R3D84_00855 [Paracoccaceae bacterium]